MGADDVAVRAGATPCRSPVRVRARWRAPQAIGNLSLAPGAGCDVMRI